jgi:carboxymethylenebutenolidase
LGERGGKETRIGIIAAKVIAASPSDAAVMGEDIKLDVDGTAMPAYLSLPSGTARGGAIVLQEIYGISAAMKNAADLLAGAGYAAIVPELFYRTDPHWTGVPGTEDAAHGVAAARAMTLDGFERDLAASAATLRQHLPAGAKLGVWGFCLGGSLAFYSATLPYVDAALSFYGGQIAKSNVLDGPPLLERCASGVRAPVLFVFGGQDQGIPAEDRERIRTTMTAEGKTFDLHVYPDVGHAFFREGLDSTQSARDAWSLVRAFLANYV